MLIGEPTCNGELTHVDLEIAGKVRRVAVTRKAIEDKLGAAAGMSPEAMCDATCPKSKRPFAGG